MRQQKRATVMKWNGMRYKWKRINSFWIRTHIHSHTLAVSCFIRCDIPPLELNNFYDKCVWELISFSPSFFFSVFGLFFIFICIVFLFVCLVIFVVVVLQSTSVAVPCCDMPLFLFDCLISKGFPIIFIWVDYLYSTEKLRCILWGAGISLRFFSLSLSSSTQRILNQSQINKEWKSIEKLFLLPLLLSFLFHITLFVCVCLKLVIVFQWFTFFVCNWFDHSACDSYIRGGRERERLE